MKLTSFLAAVEAILIASASLAFAGVLPANPSSTDIDDFNGDVSNCLDGLCHGSLALEIRGNKLTKPKKTTTARKPVKTNPPEPNKIVKPRPTTSSKKPTKTDPPNPNKLSKPISIEALPVPPGIDGPLEKKYWKAVAKRMDSKAFKGLKATDEMALYTGGAAWESMTKFEKAFEKAYPGRTMRHYINTIKSDAVLQQMTLDYKANENGRSFGPDADFKTLPNAIVSYTLVMLTRFRAKPVHLFFSTTEAAQDAARGEIPKGHLKYFEIFPITSKGSKVTEIFAWDLQTYQAHLKKGKAYKPPRIWKKGDKPLGTPIDFTVDSEKREGGKPAAVAARWTL
ncbi:hypothetical protein GLAREA_01376 [Glarea lozoyensis ATCC 20868]|uniref:Uncharacterized protein n=2 Tax=Glarea lozoyensis TaxID=101852 RepID=S3CJQ4_GLAL2|nr:uncharacterized protein GLAREA_01376 [Glarea lozoyensis ATCC 20868]EHK98951.1 hypothetical protein M7I_5242 [Glarea lozoyensis 74030]EPE25464.1 hypothetical protein GLAREA_01376 [Glarea lozoyensis ATCC 20868]